MGNGPLVIRVQIALKLNDTGSINDQAKCGIYISKPCDIP